MAATRDTGRESEWVVSGADVDDELDSVVSAIISRYRRRVRPRTPDRAEVMDDTIQEFADELDRAVSRHLVQLDQVSQLIERDAGSLVSLPEAARVAHVALQHLFTADGEHLPVSVRYVLVGLSVRAVSTMNEMSVLLRSGYAMGARSRWRTLFEIAVVAKVLALGNRHTATRFQEHRWVMLARERQRTGEREWIGSPTPEDAVRRLRRRFGDPFCGPYGWAANVTKSRLGKERPSWQDLVALSGLDEHLSRVQAAHHAVHGADALGLLGTVLPRDGGVFHPGASTNQVLATARDSIRLFRHCLVSLLEVWRRYSPSRTSEACLLLLDELLVDREVNLTYQILATDPAAMARFSDEMPGWVSGGGASA